MGRSNCLRSVVYVAPSCGAPARTRPAPARSRPSSRPLDEPGDDARALRRVAEHVVGADAHAVEREPRLRLADSSRTCRSSVHARAPADRRGRRRRRRSPVAPAPGCARPAAPAGTQSSRRPAASPRRRARAVVRGRAGSSLRASTSAAVRIVVARATPGSQRVALRRRCRTRATGSAPSTSDGQHRHRRHGARRSPRSSEAELDEADARCRRRLGHRDAEQVRLRERAARARGRTTSGSRLDGLQPLVRSRGPGEDLRASSRSASCSRVKEKSICAVLIASRAACRARPWR